MVLQLPLYINTTEESFEVNREKCRKLRAELRQKNCEKIHADLHEINRSQIVTTQDVTSNKITNINAKQQQQDQITANGNLIRPQKSAQSQKAFRWADVAQQSITSSNANKSQDFTVPPVTKPRPAVGSNKIEPLGVVLVRILFQPGFVPMTPTSIIPRGLINTGNICFMSSILQVLVHSQRLYNMLKTIETHTRTSLSRLDSTTPLLDAFLEFIDQYSRPASAPISPEGFYRSISSVSRFSHLKWGRQEDAEEFLGYFLNGLHEELSIALKDISSKDRETLLSEIHNPKIKNDVETTLAAFRTEGAVSSTASMTKPGYANQATNEWQEVQRRPKAIATRSVTVRLTPITMLFGGQFRSELEVFKSKEPKSVTLDPFQHIQLDISKAGSVEQAFKEFSEPELISYGTSEAKKQTLIDALPKILVVHLKRFTYDAARVQKVMKKVSYTHKLEIPKQCVSPKLLQSGSSLNYRLTGVVYHHGTDTDVGHYTVDVQRAAGGWARIDDTKVDKIAAEEVVKFGEESKSAYLLLYERLV